MELYKYFDTPKFVKFIYYLNSTSKKNIISEYKNNNGRRKKVNPIDKYRVIPLIFTFSALRIHIIQLQQQPKHLKS